MGWTEPGFDPKSFVYVFKSVNNLLVESLLI